MRTHTRRARAPAWAALGVIAAILVTGCGTHRGSAAAAAAATQDSLETYIAKVNALSANALDRPALPAGAARIEQADASLARALTVVSLHPTPATLMETAMQYRRVGILDRAYYYLTEAIKADPADAAAYDQRARIWRDWGFPHLGYGDAYQAVKLAPRSAAAANTLGTLFQTAENPAAARIWYEKALSLEPAAAYALNNLCYVAVLRADERAIVTCRQALAAAPDSRVAHNNLGLAYAAADDFSRAYLEYAARGDRAEALYNLGITFMARRQYGKATEAFTAALRLEPQIPQLGERLRQASLLDAPR